MAYPEPSGWDLHDPVTTDGTHAVTFRESFGTLGRAL
jgi:hypothetical protein